MLTVVWFGRQVGLECKYGRVQGIRLKAIIVELSQVQHSLGMCHPMGDFDDGSWAQKLMLKFKLFLPYFGF